MGKLRPIESVIETAKRKQIARCAVCGRVLYANDLKQLLEHAKCQGPAPTNDR